MSDAESDNGSIVLVEDDIYKESATPEPDTCAADAELGDDDVSAPAASTAFITAATFSADDDDASEEDYVDAPDMAVPLVAESETCAADAVHAVEKVAEVISAPTASAPFTTEAALCASDVADSIVVKEVTRASPAVSVPLVAGTEVWVADAGHTAAAAAEIIPVPMAYTPAIADPELSAFDAADSIAMKKDNLVALEVAASPITLGRQDVSGPVDADQGSPLALVKLVAAKSVFSQDIQHCDPGMQLPMHANNSDPLDKSRDAKACFERQDKPENHHEASAESKRATHMMNQSSLLGTAAITPPPVEASEERDELYEMFVDKDDIANHDKVDVCAEQRIISAQSTQPLQEGMTVPAERAPTPPETRTACVASDDTSVQLGNSTPSLCDDGCIAVQSALQLDGLDAGNIVVSDNLPLVPASSTTAEDMRSNDRQSTWTPSQLPTVVVRKPTPQESSPAVMILDDNELLQRASDKEVRPSLAESADSLFGGSSSREDGTPLLRGTSTDSITFDDILPHQTSDASVDTSNATKKPLGVKLGELTRTLVELAPRRPRQLLRKQLSDARLGYRGGDDSSKSGARG
ncbi:hypothetical protein LMH87_003250 [Akanthomyces muscarius]|uniref:Uncharacterized protein n=1 Tax=Akanthomyces muscarius TaxID=2231603 RepID=A0A9W8Q1K3_AKAMU|nr:hypothetical protein LMH87_003250 [Akanthomyces muscarius]KAJ4144364.1 hypothetical protein LMH87_003250 [Akanthomyces muscarius]